MALDKTIITKRLTYIKYLYQQGGLSNQNCQKSLQALLLCSSMTV